MPDAPRHLAEETPLPWWRAIGRRRLTVAIGTTFMAMPILVLDNLPARADTNEAVSTADDVTSTTAESTTTTIVVTTTTAAPTTTAPPTTAPPTTAPPTTAPPTTAPPTTAPPTTAPPVQTVAPPAEPPAGNEQHGKATWYYWNPGECAHRTLPKGTLVTVTNVATGASTTCTVTDRGPYGAGRIIDLDSTVFDDLAGLGAGVIDVVITW